MPSMTRTQIATVARTAGFPENQIAMAVAVAFAESGGNPNATHTNSNGSGDYGLFQINSVHKDLLAKNDWRDPQQNANMAYQIFKAAGNKWTPWSVFNSGSYRKFYSGTGLGTPGEAVTIPGGLPGLMQNENVAPLTEEQTANAQGAYNVQGILGFVGTSAFWQRFGIGVLGAALIIAGAIIVFRQPIAKGVSAAGSVASKGLVNIPVESA